MLNWSTNKYLISLWLTHLALMLSQIERSSDWKRMLEGPGADPEIEGDLIDAINALHLVADKYAQALDLQTATLEDHANDNAEIAQQVEQDT